MSEEKTSSRGSRVSCPLAPEDVRAGDYICVHNVVYEFPPFFCDSADWNRTDLLRYSFLPPAGGTPLRVIETCVPYILVESHDGSHHTLDLRRHRVARVSERYGSKAFKRLKRKKIV